MSTRQAWLPSAPPLPTEARWRQPALLLASVALLAIVLVQCLVSISPDIYWDVSPRSELGNIPITVLGPAAVAWLNTASVTLAAAALAVHLLAGGRIGWASVVLAAAGAVACAYHMPRHAENLFRCGNWLAAVALALAAMHLAQHERPRRFFAAALIALLVPLTIHAAWFIWVEYPETVRLYQAQRESLLESQGWAAGSPQDLIYQRRLLTPLASGAFGLSNVFGSLAAALCLLAATVALALLRAGQRRAAILPAALTLMGLLSVALARSRGAAAALVLAAGLLTLIKLAERRTALRRWLAPAALALVAAVVLAVLLRGWAGPPASAVGERSVLFRFQYWQAALRILNHEGAGAWLRGVGPGSFQTLYALHKNPLNPEEVTSTHNVFLDLVTMLGLGGAAWAGLLGMWLYGGAKSVFSSAPEPDPAEREPKNFGNSKQIAAADAGWALLLTVLALGTQYVYRLPELDLPGALAWLAGAVGFAVVTTGLFSTTRLSGQTLRAGLLLAALALLIHNQIEMTFFHQGSAVAAFVIVALAASPLSPWEWAGVKASAAVGYGFAGGVGRLKNALTLPSPGGRGGEGTLTLPSPGGRGGEGALTLPSPGGRGGEGALTLPSPKGRGGKSGFAVPVAMVVAAGVMAVSYAAPVARQQEMLAEAARLYRADNLPATIRQLDAAIGQLPSDPKPCRWRSEILVEWAHAAAATERPDEAARLLDAAAEYPPHVTKAVRDDLGLLRTQARAQGDGAELLDDPQRLEAAARAWEKVIARAPFGLRERLEYADTLWKLGRGEPAREQYRRVLELHRQSYLDPLRQLSDKDKAKVEERFGSSMVGERRDSREPTARGQEPRN